MAMSSLPGESAGARHDGGCADTRHRDASTHAKSTRMRVKARAATSALGPVSTGPMRSATPKMA